MNQLTLFYCFTSHLSLHYMHVTSFECSIFTSEIHFFTLFFFLSLSIPCYLIFPTTHSFLYLTLSHISTSLLDFLLAPRDAMDAAARYILRISHPSAPVVHPPPLGLHTIASTSGPVPVIVPIGTLANSASLVGNASNTERRSGVQSAITSDNDFMIYSTLVSSAEHAKDIQCMCCAVHPRLQQLDYQS